MKECLVAIWKSLTKYNSPYFQMFSSLLMIGLSLCSFFFIASVAYANEKMERESSPLWQEIKDGFDYTVRAICAGNYLTPAESSQNPDNDFLKLKQQTVDFELRPDFFLAYHQLELMAKPRASLTYEKLDIDNAPDEDAWVDETWINEYRIRYGVKDYLFLSYGRENLQWGPTMLVSPSNPFFLNTGRASSQTELAGKGFARLVYIPSMAWTVSLIANLDKGPDEETSEDFENIYALKLDYTGLKGYTSLILSHQEGMDDNNFGMFGGFTAIDNTLLYFEGEVSTENNALYPISIERHPLGGQMSPKKQDDDNIDGSLIVGGTYTFETLVMLSFEFFYNGRGYSEEEAEEYYDLRKNAEDAYFTGPYTRLARQTLGNTAVNGLQYLRRHYLLMQISRSDIGHVLDLRYILTYNIDDDSNMSILNADYNLNDHTELYLNAVYNHGSTDTEFNSIFDYRISLGCKYTF